MAAEGHRFLETLENAALHRFAFLKHQGMPLHNNAAELEIRDMVVLHRIVRHQLSGLRGRQVFSTWVSVARACQKQDAFPRVAMEGVIRDPY